MYNFFSLLSSGDGRVYYLSPEQRIIVAKILNGGKCLFDSYTSISMFYELDKDKCNKWGYNPFSGKLVLDVQNTANDQEAVLEEIKKIDFNLIYGDIEGTREFVKHLGMIKFLDGHGNVPDDVKMFETMEEACDVADDDAYDDAWNSARDDALDASWKASRDAVRSSAMGAAWDSVWDAARDAAWDTSRGAARYAVDDAALFTRLIYVCSGLPVDQKHIDYINKRWSVWEAGYGVLCDVGGILYCYKKA